MGRSVTMTADQFAEKQARRLKAASQDIKAGIEAVTENPCEKAAAAQDKMLSKLTESVQSGKWGRALKRVPLDEWRSKFINIGIARIGPGIDAAKAKVTAFAAELLPYVKRGQDGIKNMPTLTVEDGIARCNQFIRHMAGFKRS